MKTTLLYDIILQSIMSHNYFILLQFEFHIVDYKFNNWNILHYCYVLFFLFEPSHFVAKIYHCF